MCAAQVLEVLDAMGGLLKSEDEDLAEQQLTASEQLFRVTAMVRSLTCCYVYSHRSFYL